MKDLKLINYIDLISESMLAFLNAETPPVNAKGKYCVNMNQENKKKISFFLDSYLENNKFFGKKTVIINTCEIGNNWRKNMDVDLFLPKYKLTDTSVWVDWQAMNKFFDKEFKRLKNKNPKCIFISIDNLDSFDLIFYIKYILKINCFNENKYNIIEDGNQIYSRNNDYPNFILQNIELEFKANKIIL